ncbi:ankyrin homolog [Patella vulgata]|uniref:ankyrin homolog n=1 Tax=Patella vulgata TaxID=6465 RepID=UPI0024A98303|nr:ankyrin homolog [Patella vulgata]
MAAAERGPKPMVETLLRAGCNINLQDHRGKTALMFAVDNQDETILSLQLQNGADCNICDVNGKTALMVAVEKQRYGHCEAWMKSGASVNQVDNSGNTALLIAVKMNNTNMVKVLLKAGTDVNLSDNNGKTALILEFENQKGMHCENLLKSGASVNHADNDGNTALMIAVGFNNRNIVNDLLKSGADVNLSDDNGTTAVMAAARNCNRPILESLLDAGADVNKTDTGGRSAIHGIIVACRCRKWIKCLKLLLINKCHASLDTPGENGNTLLQWLLKKNKEDLIWYLVTENCSLKSLNLRLVKYKFRFPDTLMLFKILFESGAPKNVIFSRSTYDVVLSGSKSTRNKELVDFRDFCKSRSLKSRCRREIRNSIGPGISNKISQVGLPKFLQDYVVMKDLIPEKYFTLVG